MARKLGGAVSVQTFAMEEYMPEPASALGGARRAARVVTGLHLADHRHLARKSSPRSKGSSRDSEVSKGGFARALGARLREARRQRGLTLQNVEKGSDGAFTSVTLSSYERGDRRLSVARLVELASFYGVSPAELLPSGGSGAAQATSVVSVDLLRVAKLPPYQAGPLLAAARASTMRGGTRFTLGGERLARVARAYGLPVNKVVDLLASWGVFSPVSA
jgi:transcriptional regulator with XRE-family HTH domain